MEVIRALVLAGLPTTNTLILRLATALMALPCAEKMAALASSKSLRSIPGLHKFIIHGQRKFNPSQIRQESPKKLVVQSCLVRNQKMRYQARYPLIIVAQFLSTQLVVCGYQLGVPYFKQWLDCVVIAGATLGKNLSYFFQKDSYKYFTLTNINYFLNVF